jgi:nucleoside-diphosphate-sugar epimerase
VRFFEPQQDPTAFQNSMPVALITGGCGFVGRHFAHRLAFLGHDVWVVDNLASSGALHPDAWPLHLRCEARFIQMDVRDFFNAGPKDQDYELILHLAAIVEGRAVIENDPLAVAEDLAIDAMFFKWVTSLDTLPRKVVYFSSSAAYPVALQTVESPHALHEMAFHFSGSLPKDLWIGLPDLTYGWAKMTGEYLACIAHKTYGLNVVCYRPFSGYGEDQHPSYPFPAILNRVLNGDDPVEIWSDSVRDFVYIEDVVDCVLSTMRKVNDGGAVNIGTGTGTSFASLVQTMAGVVGRPATARVRAEKPQGVYYRVADTRRLASLGYKATTSLSEGVQKCLAHWKKTR